MAKRNAKGGKFEIRKELCETFVEEWTEWRVYRGNELVKTCHSEREAKTFVRKAAA